LTPTAVMPRPSITRLMPTTLLISAFGVVYI
jgi:hypothetical protein